MVADLSWDVVPVANPDLPPRKRSELFERAVRTDPVGLAEPVYQYRDREQLVVPSCLDQPSRELLLRAEKAIVAAIDGEAAVAAEQGVLCRRARCCGMNGKSRWPCGISRLELPSI